MATFIPVEVTAWLAPSIYFAACKQPGCSFVASACRDGAAVQALSAHICAVHMPRGTITVSIVAEAPCPK